jgi:hypothetical protein
MPSGALRVGLLCVDRCPNRRELAPHLRGLLDGAGIDAKIELQRVGYEEEARSSPLRPQLSTRRPSTNPDSIA